KSLITNEGRNPDMRVTPNGRAHVAYTLHDALGYAVAGTATGSFDYGKIPSTSGYDNDPLLALDAGGRAHIVYENSVSGYHLRYAHQTTSGWGTPKTVTVQVGGFGYDIDTNGTSKVAQAEPTGIHLYTLSGSTWGNTTISAIANAENVVLRRAFSGTVAIAFTRSSGGIWVT